MALDFKRRTFLYLAPAIIAAPSLMRIHDRYVTRYVWEYYSRQRIVEYGERQWWTIGPSDGHVLATREEAHRYFWNMDVEYRRVI